MAKIRRDRHGLYLRTGGYVFRPVETRHTPVWPFDNTRTDGTSVFSEGDTVKARHIGQTPMAKVGDGDTTEYWSGHGDEDGAWDPKPQTQPMGGPDLLVVLGIRPLAIRRVSP